MANHTSITVGTFVYDLLFYTGEDSILGKPYVMPHAPLVVLYRSVTHALLFFSSARKCASAKLDEKAENAEQQHGRAGCEVV